jgi:hypothetical protein
LASFIFIHLLFLDEIALRARARCKLKLATCNRDILIASIAIRRCELGGGVRRENARKVIDVDVDVDVDVEVEVNGDLGLGLDL